MRYLIGSFTDATHLVSELPELPVTRITARNSKSFARSVDRSKSALSGSFLRKCHKQCHNDALWQPLTEAQRSVLRGMRALVCDLVVVS